MGDYLLCQPAEDGIKTKAQKAAEKKEREKQKKREAAAKKKKNESATSEAAPTPEPPKEGDFWKILKIGGTFFPHAQSG